MRYDDHKWKPGRRYSGGKRAGYCGWKRETKAQYRRSSRSVVRTLLSRLKKGDDPDGISWPLVDEVSNPWNWD